jgi:hemolysin III
MRGFFVGTGAGDEARSLRKAVRELQKARRRAERKELVRLRNEPPRLTKREEAVNAASHGAGALMAIACMTLLLLKSDTPLKLMASLFYGVSMVFMMLASCIYHAMPTGSTAKRVCRRFDYASICLLIGGTFAPILLAHIGGVLGVTLFCVQWGIIAAGVALVLAFGPGRWRGLLFTLYFALGWSGLGFVPELCARAPALLWFILMGGVVYTAGMVPFARRRKYDHCVWHFLVLAAAALHWLGIYTQIY